MGIRIESISVTGLGPVPSVHWAFKDINLIYGKNEQGKTFLVEYLLRSLFKNAPQTRDLTDSGQVVVSGIGEKLLNFHPKSKDKIEDLLPNLGKGTNIDLARLCVIKGGELSLTSAPGGTVTKSILKDYLSDQGMLDRILERVPVVVRETTWENGEIVPKRNSGLIKTWKEAQRDLELIHELKKAVDTEYSQGQAKKASVELEDARDLIALQRLAKRAHAYQLSILIEKAQEDLERIPEDAITKARLSTSNVGNLRDNLQNAINRLEVLQPKVEHYPWLKSAIGECEKRPGGLKKDVKGLFIILSIISILATSAAAFLQPFISVGFGLITVLFIILAVRQFHANLQTGADQQEVEKIYAEAKIKLGKKMMSLATLKSSFDSMESDYIEAEGARKQIAQFEEDFAKAEGEKKRDLTALGWQGDEQDPEEFITQCQENRTKINKNLGKLKEELAATNVTSDQYFQETVKVKYNPSELTILEGKSSLLEETIRSEETRLQLLKQRVCDQTNDDMAVGWEDLIENLRRKYLEAIESSLSAHAQVVGGIFITEAIADLRMQEDEHIHSALASRNMSEPIQAITPTYSGVVLDEEELVVFNSMERYPLSAMSTGAKEQVLLALRIGLAAHVLGDEKMFLILDDAFQHSDWSRRERLVDEMATLADTGWQIIYFSMDDHIRKLFEERVKPIAKKRYQSFELKKE